MAPVVQRFSALAPLGQGDMAALRHAAGSSRLVAPFSEIAAEGAPLEHASVVLSGWAYRARYFADGRLQVLGLLLPGELIGNCRHRHPLAITTKMSATEVVLCPAPEAGEGSAFSEIYAMSSALEEVYLLRQIARLGRLSAYERTIDWMLEAHERLSLSGLARPDSFSMPLTQTMLSDLLGITSVHLSRTIQALRREGLIDLRRGTISFADRERLAAMVDYRPARITESGSAQSM
jgi:CRP-like cAMP-binding protein